MSSPQHQTQLTGIATQSVDCGVRSTSMAIDWATGGLKRPPVKILRQRMGKVLTSSTALKDLTTSPSDWKRAIESYDTPAELGGKYEGLSGRLFEGGSWSDVAEHLERGRLAILAVDYGVYRRLMPARSGSRTFDGYHAIPFKGLRDGTTTSFDSLLDGRYRGCPKGPIRVPIGKVREATLVVGRQEVGRNSVFGYLPNRATNVGSGVVIPEPEETSTLASILAGMYELHDGLDAAAAADRADLAELIDDLESLIGPYQGQAQDDDEPEAGVTA